MGTYNLTNRMGGQIREKIDLGLSELISLSLGQIRKTSVNFFPNWPVTRLISYKI